MDANDDEELLYQDPEPAAFENESFMLCTSLDCDDSDDNDEESTSYDQLPVVRTQIFPPFRMTVEEMNNGSKKESSPLRACLTSRPCSVCLYLILVLIILCCIILLVVVSLLVAKPYKKVSGYYRSHCYPVAMEYLNQEERCSCGKGCSSHYPCLVISVNYSTAENVSYIAELANDETNLYQKCTVYPHCSSSQTDNVRVVREFAQKYGAANGNFSCLYNPANPSEVIRKRRFRLCHVIHGLLWSSIFLIMALFFLYLLFKYRGCDVSDYVT